MNKNLNSFTEIEVIAKMFFKFIQLYMDIFYIIYIRIYGN